MAWRTERARARVRCTARCTPRRRSWATPRCSEVVDPTLLREVHAKKKVLAVFHVVLESTPRCEEPDPEMRPRMRVVAESLDRRFPIRISAHRALGFTRRRHR